MVPRPDRVARRWRLHPIVPISLALLAVVATVFARTMLGDDEDAGGDAAPAASTTEPAGVSTTVPTTAAPPAEPADLDALLVEPLAEEVPSSYRITYDVVDDRGSSTETWTVRRPYESLVVRVRDGQQLSGTATSRTDLWTYLSDRDAWYPIQPELHRAALDPRPLAAMATMVELGLVERPDPGARTAEYAGRGCTVFVTGEPLSSETVAAPGGPARTSVCVDADGLVLHERQELDGTPVRERTATSVTVDPEIDPARFDPTPRAESSPELDALVAGSIAVEADEETRASLLTDVESPAGYALDGVVFRASASESDSAGATEVVRFYSDGTDLIEVAEVTAAGGVVLGGGGARPVAIEGFDEVWFDPDFRASALRVRVNDTTFLELRGAVPARLVAVLSTLTLRSR